MFSVFLRPSQTLRACVILFAASATAMAQGPGVIRGRVTDASSARAVSNVSVSIVGTNLGGITNANGEYAISNVPTGQQTLATRRLGYARMTRAVEVVAGEVRADFDLSPTVTQLEQIVTTGTAGSAERKTIGNAITTIDVADLTSKASVGTVMEVFQGKTPGLTVMPGSGVPGTGEEIRIRGASSMSGYKPVVFVDGIRYNIDDIGGFSATGGGTLGLAQSTQITSALHNLNPMDIESVEIIKGPAAATLYGADAANGVIQIITKKGRRGQQGLRWNLRNERGQSKWNLLPETNYTTCDAIKQAQVVSATDTTHVWPGCQGLTVNSIITDNPMARDARALRTAELNRFSLSVSGGGDRYSFYGAGDRDNEQGVFYNSDNSRTSFRTNFGFAPNDKSDFAVNLNWSDGRLRLPIQDESANGLLLSARRGLPGRLSLLGAGNEGWRTISPTAANRYKNFTKNERLTLGSVLNFTPLTWFRNRITAGFDRTNTQAQLLFLPGDIDVTQDPDAGSGANLRRVPVRQIVTLEYVGNLTWQPKSDWETTTSFGSQVVADKTETLGATGIGIGASDITLVNLLQRTTGSEAFSENNSVGYYVQEQVGWKNRLYITGAVRADDHSAFGTDFDLIVYPKFSVAYVISDEPAAKRFLDAARVTSLKLRTAWGQAGRAPTAYSAPQTYTVDRVTLGTTTGSALRTSTIGNPDLKSERGEEIELGFDAGLLSDRLGVDFTFYNKTTSDMLQSIAVPASTGFLGVKLVNLGEVNNRGVELSLWGSPVQTRNVTLESRFSFATNRNELVSFGQPGKLFDSPSGQAYGVVQQHRVGYPLGGFWLTPPQRDANGAAVLTPAGAAIFDTAQTSRLYWGTPIPKREIGFSNTLTVFQNFHFYALLDHKGGHKVFNLQERNRCQTANDNCARVNNPAARFPQGTTAADSILFKELAVYRSTSVSPEWIQPGDFIKLREVSLSVDVPTRYAQKARASSASLVLSARNLALWTDYEGADPEVNSYGGRNFVRVDAYAAPMTRRLSATINLQY